MNIYKDLTRGSKKKKKKKTFYIARNVFSLVLLKQDKTQVHCTQSGYLGDF